jgi:hypothetical protein
MSDDTTTDDSTDTLTLTARGPAAAARRPDVGEMSVTITEDVRLKTVVDVNADWIESHGGVYKSGAHLKASEAAGYVTERLGEAADADYAADHDEWSFTLSARVDEWANIAARLAKRRGSAMWSNAKVATTACHILSGLAEYAPDDRPRLAMLDLVEQYDVSDYTREGILDELGEGNRAAGVEEVDVHA